MLKKDIKYINKIYSNRYNQKIPGYKKVGWGSKSSQNLRFRILTENLVGKEKKRCEKLKRWKCYVAPERYFKWENLPTDSDA